MPSIYERNNFNTVTTEEQIYHLSPVKMTVDCKMQLFLSLKTCVLCLG